MMRPIDFRGFRFGNIHSSDLNLEVVSTSNRYEARTLPNPTDTAVDIPGSDGQYLFGSVYKNREITVNVAFDSVSEEIYRKIRQLFATDKPQDLVFDEEPYKTWKAKLKSKPEFKSLCFTDRDTGERVYKGDGKLQFICYFPYAFGFEKYVVRAADYYLLTPPEQILCELSNAEDDIFINTIETPAPARWLPEDIKYHYNANPHENLGWDPNDKLSWKGGFPTIEQVQVGELYFDGPYGEHTIVTTRGYWDNIPEWQGTAKLLTTPTLDYEQELMYLPQYSKTSYINMETGFDSSRPMIGSRLLVYNPGDLPIDWELRIDVNKKGFWSARGGKFRVRRFNVERLTIPQAVDWCGLTTFLPEDNDGYKYGNKYFKRKKIDLSQWDETWEQGKLPANKTWEDMQYAETNDSIAYNLHLDDAALKEKIDTLFNYEDLGQAHPKHCYYIEPIPRERLGHFIKLFFWQTTKPNLNYEDGIKFANRYEELLKQCITKEEEYELYWHTLRELFSNYSKLHIVPENLFTFFVNNPLEFIGLSNLDAAYDENDFNANIYPKWLTEDYLEIDTTQLAGVQMIQNYMSAMNSDELSIFTGNIVYYDPDKLRQINPKLERQMSKLLNKNDPINNLLDDYYYLNSETRMLYSTENPIGDRYHYKPNKIVMNEAITKGKWFKLPPGWSIIMIEPVIDKSIWGGKRWLDARPFDWGYGGDEVGHERAVSQLYNYVYDRAKNFFFDKLYPDFSTKNGSTAWPTENQPANDSDLDTDEKINFELMYQRAIDSSGISALLKTYYIHQKIIAEYKLLNLINDYWQMISPYYIWTAANDCKNSSALDINGKYTRLINGDISDWWWYACNYIWANFPPLYWAAADCFNHIQIKYTPLFY